MATVIAQDHFTIGRYVRPDNRWRHAGTKHITLQVLTVDGAAFMVRAHGNDGKLKREMRDMTLVEASRWAALLRHCRHDATTHYRVNGEEPEIIVDGFYAPERLRRLALRAGVLPPETATIRNSPTL